MVHKLTVEIEYRFDQQYTGLKQWELPRGSIVSIIFYLTNIGEMEFNGILKEVRITMGESGFQGAQVSRKVEGQIRAVPQQKIKIHESSVLMIQEGLGWIKAEIKSNDDQPIEYYQITGNPPLPEWAVPFVIINSEQLEIIKLLKEIRDRVSNPS